MSESWKNQSWVEYVHWIDHSSSQKWIMIHSWIGLIWFSNATQIEITDPITAINSSLEINNDIYLRLSNNSINNISLCIHESI